MLLGTLGILSGGLQALGYYFYIRLAVKGENTPNPLSWLMFGYGTALLFFLELDRDPTWQVLILPFVCALGSLRVVYLCWKRGGYEKKVDVWDKISFGLDLALTLCYLASWILTSRGLITEGERQIASLAILICWNIGIFTAFGPILRDVDNNPDHERSLPWVIWMCAYAVLFAATLADDGITHPEILLYPGINCLIHGAMAWKSRRFIRAGAMGHR